MSPTPAASSPHPGPFSDPSVRLYMIEATVRDHSAAVSWLRDVLGFALLWHDSARRFALFEITPGGVRLAIKAHSSGDDANSSSATLEEAPAPPQRITFETTNLESTLAALSLRNARLGPITDHPDEGYRKAKLVPPPGVELDVAIFGWTSDQVRRIIHARATGAR